MPRRSTVGGRGVVIPDRLELDCVGRLHRGQNRLGDHLVAGEWLAGQHDLGRRQIAARHFRRHPAALDILSQNLDFVGLGQLDVVTTGEADPVARRIDERFQMGDDRDAGRDPGRVVSPACDFFLG